MNYIYVALFSFFNLLFVQDEIPVFQYEIRYNLGKSLVKKGYVFEHKDKVYFTATKSVFLEDLPKLTTNEDTGMPNINIMLDGVLTENIITLKKTSKLEHLTSVGNQIFVTEENIAKQNWEPTGNKKKISGKDCIEMTTNFRGRNYIAYVDLSVPFSHGPWKFNNFPGLPVVIKDTEGKLNWTLTQINTKTNAEIESFERTQLANFSNYEKKSLKEYAELYEKTRGGVATVASKMPRDFEPRSNTGFKRIGLELKYEWEGENTNN